MSHTHDYGKDRVIFVSAEDHAAPSTVQLPAGEQSPGLILESGEINWNCPCLGGMATGPCGVEFRDAFSCFHYSEETPKGTECFETFKTMQDCFAKYPAVYDKSADGSGSADDADQDAALAESDAATASSSARNDVESVDQLEEPQVSAAAASPSSTAAATVAAKG